jgi:hypothetical protein
MPQIVAVIGLLLLVSLSGGIGASSVSQPEETGRVLVSGGEPSSVVKPEPAPQTPVSSNFTPIVTSQPIVADVIDTRLPKVTTYSAQNVNSNSATARALVNSYDKKGKNVYIVYGYDERKVRAVASEYKTFSSIPALVDDKVRVMSVDTYIEKEETYATSLSYLVDETTYYYTFCLEYEGGKTCGNVSSFKTVESNYRSDYFYQPSVYLSSVSNIEAYSAKVSGSYQMNDGEDGVVFLVYGTSQNLVNAVSNEENYSDIDEEDEALQVVRLAVSAIGSGKFDYAISGLDRDTQYFYRVCAEYDGDENSGMTCSYSNSFTTDRRDQSDNPDAVVNPTTAIGRTAPLSGFVSMNDFNDGHAFFVYGTSESSVEGAQKSNSFNGIYQYGDSLQKVSLDTDLDNDDSFTKTVRDLLPSTVYYYRMCAEYEDEGDYYYSYSTLYLACSEVKSFTTGL